MYNDFSESSVTESSGPPSFSASLLYYKYYVHCLDTTFRWGGHPHTLVDTLVSFRCAVSEFPSTNDQGVQLSTEVFPKDYLMRFFKKGVITFVHGRQCTSGVVRHQ